MCHFQVYWIAPLQDELLERKAIAEKVIDRLAYEDSVLIPLNKTGLGGARGDQDGGAQAEDPYLVVHPNFVADEGFWVCVFKAYWVFVS